MDNTVLVIITALISGLLATVVTIWWQKRAEIHRAKLQIFQTLMSYRYAVASEESVKALNSIDVVFYADKSVRKAYADFLNEANKRPEFNPNTADKHLKLLEEMSKALGLKDIHWDEIKQVYYPHGLSEKEQEEAVLRKMQIQSTEAVLKATQSQQNTPSQNQFSQELVAQLLPELIKNPDGFRSLMEIGERYGKKSTEAAK